MYKSLKTKNHLTTCGANFSRLRKILCDFQDDAYTFEILNHNQKNLAECGASNFYIYRNVLKYLNNNKIIKY